MIEGPFKEQLAAFQSQLKARIEDSPALVNIYGEEGTGLRNSLFGFGRLRFAKRLSEIEGAIENIEARTKRYRQTLDAVGEMRWFDASRNEGDPSIFSVTSRIKTGHSASLNEMKIEVRMPPKYNPSNEAPKILALHGTEGPVDDTGKEQLKSPISIPRATALADSYLRIVHALFPDNLQTATQATPEAAPQPVLA